MWEGASDARTLSVCGRVSDLYTPMVNVKISSLNGGVEGIGKLSVTSAFFFPINLIDPRLVTLPPKLFAVANAALIGDPEPVRVPGSVPCTEKIAQSWVDVLKRKLVHRWLALATSAANVFTICCGGT